MMKRVVSILAVVAMLLGGCSGRYEELLDRAEACCAQQPDSALLLLQTVNSKRIVSRRVRARHIMLYVEALDKTNFDLTGDSLIMPAVKYYDRHGTNLQKAKAHYYLARIYENAGIIDTAILELETAELCTKNISNNQINGLIASTLARCYQAQFFSQLALDEYLKAYECFNTTGSKVNPLYSLIGAINVLLTEQDYGKVKYYTKLAKGLAIQIDNSDLLCYLDYVEAQLMVSIDKDYSGALSTIFRSVNKYYNGVMPSSYYLCVGNTYLNLNKPDSAAVYLQPAIDNMDSVINSRPQMELCYFAGKLMSQQGKYKEAYNYTNKALRICDSLYFGEKNNSVVELKERFHNQQLEERNRYIQKIHNYQLYIALSLFIVLAFVAMWLITRRQKRIVQYRNEIEEYGIITAKLKEEYELALSSQRALSLGNNIATSENNIEFLKQLIDATALYYDNNELFASRIKQLLFTDHVDKDATQSVTQLFKELLNARQSGALDYLRTQYPQLTEQDINLYSMVCIGLSTSSICLLLKCKPKTYYNYRNILRNRLGISNSGLSVQEHFKTICANHMNN